MSDAPVSVTTGAHLPDDPLDNLLHDFDSAAFDSIIGQVAVVDQTGRIYSVNEAWSRLGYGQWGEVQLRPGDNVLEVLRKVAASGDDYAQSAVMGLSSVLNGLLPTFSLKYPAPTDHGLGWFKLQVNPAGGSAHDFAFMVIREEDKVTSTLSTDAGSRKLAMLSKVLAGLTHADSVLVFLRPTDASRCCELVAQSNVFPVQVQPFHDVAGSPCNTFPANDFVFCQTGAQRAYPDAAWLQESGANGFATVAIREPDGEVLGHLALINHNGLPDLFAVETSLRLLGARAVGELKRIRLDRNNRSVDRGSSDMDSKYAALLHAVPDSVLVLDAHLTVIDANRAAGEMFGRPAFQMIGRPVNEFAPTASTQPLTRDEGSWRGGVSFERFDGKHVEIELSVTAMLDQGERRFVAICRAVPESAACVTQTDSPEISDVEQRRNHAILQSLPDVVFFVDRAGRLLGIRGQQEQAEDGYTTLVEKLLGGAEGRRLQTAVTQATGKNQLVVFETSIDVDGNQRAMQVRISPYRPGEAAVLLRELPSNGRDSEGDVGSEEGDASPKRYRRNEYALTFRELTILGYLASGKTDKGIAEQLCLSIYTVNKHVANILGKMQATSRTEAAVRAARERLVA
jgi:PAS domain S-box-containing protein